MNNSYSNELHNSREMTERLEQRLYGLFIGKRIRCLPTQLQEKIEAFKDFLQEYNKRLMDVLAICNYDDIQINSRIIQEERGYKIEFVRRLDELELMFDQIGERKQGRER